MLPWRGDFEAIADFAKGNLSKLVNVKLALKFFLD